MPFGSAQSKERSLAEIDRRLRFIESPNHVQLWIRGHWRKVLLGDGVNHVPRPRLRRLRTRSSHTSSWTAVICRGFEQFLNFHPALLSTPGFARWRTQVDECAPNGFGSLCSLFWHLSLHLQVLTTLFTGLFCQMLSHAFVVPLSLHQLFALVRWMKPSWRPGFADRHALRHPRSTPTWVFFRSRAMPLVISMNKMNKATNGADQLAVFRACVCFSTPFNIQPRNFASCWEACS